MSKSNQLLDALFAKDKALASKISDEIARDFKQEENTTLSLTCAIHAASLGLDNIVKRYLDLIDPKSHIGGLILDAAGNIEVFKLITDKLGYTSTEKSFKDEITTLLNWALSRSSTREVPDILLDQATPDELNPYPMTTTPNALAYTRSKHYIDKIINKMGKVDYIEQLHKALAAYNTYTAKELLKAITPEELTRTDISGGTVLHTATRYFRVDASR